VISKTFIVSQLRGDAILGIPFLKRHKCHIDCNKLAVLLAGCELACVDRFGRPLVGRVQVVLRCTIPGGSRATVRCRENCGKISDLGWWKGHLEECSS